MVDKRGPDIPRTVPTHTGTATVGDVELAYETIGSSENPPVLLVAGLGAQLVSWNDLLCAQVALRGWWVIRYDNRDIGLSSRVPEPARLEAVLGGAVDEAPYRLHDMARDAIGLLDVLGVDSAHVVGVSMGGMIAQQLAIDHPERLRSLTSVMSTPGPAVAPPTPEATALLMPAPVRNADDAADQAVAAARITGSRELPFEEQRIRRQARMAYDRSADGSGVNRQLAAILASGDRSSALADVRIPTLVLHGDADPMIPVVGGEATAAAIADAELVVIEDMGHDVPESLFGRVTDLIDDFWRRVEDVREEAGPAAAGGAAGA